ncbi:MAG: sugar phosphate isomerase/epimerase [Defluviitaleaceae bacterium]|nr:sugar phosphate isomerase/epimerase [Defluviitaleaceae bacterium]
MAALNLKSRAGVADGVRWGYALGWYGEIYGLKGESDLMGKLKFLKKYNFKSTHASVKMIDGMSDADREEIFSFLAENDLDLMPSAGFNYLAASDDEAKSETDMQLKLLDKYVPLLRNRIVHSGLAAGHRFDRERPLDETLGKLSERIGPLAEGCAQIGTPLCAENHGDYYVSDIVKICQTTPHFYLFLDTGNTYLLGEKPLSAFYEAAPFTVGTHFKDQRVRPMPRANPLHFEVGNSDLGGGDVPLRECWEILRKYSPAPNQLCMLFEMFPPPGMEVTECLEKSIAFVRTFEGCNL